MGQTLLELCGLGGWARGAARAYRVAFQPQVAAAGSGVPERIAGVGGAQEWVAVGLATHPRRGAAVAAVYADQVRDDARVCGGASATPAAGGG